MLQLSNVAEFNPVLKLLIYKRIFSSYNRQHQNYIWVGSKRVVESFISELIMIQELDSWFNKQSQGAINLLHECQANMVASIATLFFFSLSLSLSIKIFWSLNWFFSPGFFTSRYCFSIWHSVLLFIYLLINLQIQLKTSKLTKVRHFMKRTF